MRTWNAQILNEKVSPRRLKKSSRLGPPRAARIPAEFLRPRRGGGEEEKREKREIYISRYMHLLCVNEKLHRRARKVRVN